MKELKEMVTDIANELSNEEINAIEWLESALDLRYIVNSSGECISGQVLVAFGGPNIWVNFDEKEVKGYWGGEQQKADFIDKNDIEDTIIELWESRK